MPLSTLFFFLSRLSACATATTVPVAMASVQTTASARVTRRRRVGEAGVCGEGRSTGQPVQIGEEVNRVTVTDSPQTLRYLRVITSVGISVISTPTTAITPAPVIASFQFTHSTIWD